MSVEGDSAEDFMLIHVLSRERLPVLSCGLASNTLNILLFAHWETIDRHHVTPAPVDTRHSILHNSPAGLSDDKQCK